jgi:hypothetical protein
MGAIFNVFPLILIPVLTYNIWAFGATARTVTADGASKYVSIWPTRGCACRWRPALNGRSRSAT